MPSESMPLHEEVGPTRPQPYDNSKSLEFSFRARRFQRIEALIEDILARKGYARILDLGGTETYWLIGSAFLNRNRHRLSITLVNLQRETVKDADLFSSIAGDATDPALLAGQRFDLVHSNSVVEHVGTFAQMQAYAANVKRLGDSYYIQTPNYWFPFEPHFRFPGFQYLPRFVQKFLITHFAVGFFPRITDRQEADQVLLHNRLIGYRQMASLFAEAEISFERAYGLKKSIIAIGHGDPAEARTPGSLLRG